MKMLLFDYRESEHEFFEKNEFKDIDITFFNGPLNEMTRLSEEQLNETDVVSVFIHSNLTEEVLKKFCNLRVVATRSTGYNHIDLKYCTEKHISVFNVERYGQTAVAQFTIALMMALVRNLIPAYLGMQKFLVNHADYEGRNFDNMTIGILGGGAIGSAVAKLAHSLGMTVLICSIDKDAELGKMAEYTDFETLLEKSDVFSLHIPYTPENHHLISKREFKKMKDGVFIINTARGELVDTVALYENLQSGKVKGAALDVLECEYLTLNETSLSEISETHSKCMTSILATKKLMAMENVIITPHIAYNTAESIDTLLETTFNNIRDFAKGMHTNQVC